MKLPNEQAIVFAQEIKRLLVACANSDSEYLKRNYRNKIKETKQELKEFCEFQGIDYYDTLEHSGFPKIEIKCAAGNNYKLYINKQCVCNCKSEANAIKNKKMLLDNWNFKY